MFLGIIIVFSIFTQKFCNSMPTDDYSELSVPDACRGIQYCPYKPHGCELLEEKMNAVLEQFLDTRSKRSTVSKGDQEILVESQAPKLSPKSDWDNCPYVTERSLLYSINYTTEKGVKKDIVVQTKELQQIFEMVSCANDYIPDSDEQCFQNLPLKDFGLESRCVQNFVKRSVFVYNLKQNQIVVKYHDFPISCSCELSYRR